MNLRFEILKAVAAKPGAPISEIADAISYDRQKTAWSVRDCASDGLLAKRLDDVTRQPGYTLTEAGKKRLAEGPANKQGGNLKKAEKAKSGFNAGPRDKADAKKVEAEKGKTSILLGVLADISAAVGNTTGKIMLIDLAEHIRLRIAELEAAPATLRAELKKADDELEQVQRALAGRVYIVGDLDEMPAAADCATRAAAVIDQLTSANRDHLNMIAIASETLSPLVSGDIDTSDMDLHEIAEQAAARIAAKDTELLEQARVVVALRDTITMRNAELSNAQALVEKLEHLLQSARNEAEHLRRQAAHTEDGLDGQPLGNLLMGAREFLEVGQRVTVTGGEAKVEVRALNITFDLAPHEVSEVLEHATALERKLPVPF